MRSPRGDTKRQILDIAEQYLMERGYHAFSYQHIAQRLGVKAPAVHYHFKKKPDLIASVLLRYQARFRKWSARLSTASSVERIDGYIALSRSFVEAGCACLIGMMAADFMAVPESVQALILTLHEEIAGWIAEVLIAGRECGELEFLGDPVDKAAEVMCALLGAEQLGRVRGVVAFDAVAHQIRLSLGACPSE